MAQIGTFKRTKTGFSGHIRTLALDAKLILVPVGKSDVENAPDYRIHLVQILQRICSAHQPCATEHCRLRSAPARLSSSPLTSRGQGSDAVL